jgi:type VI secretion system protein ImpL
MRKWLVLAGVIAGLLAFSALVWFAFPFIAVGDISPFDSWIVRLSIILVVVLLVAGIYGWRAWSARRAARKIEEALLDAEGKDDDSKVLSERMAGAIDTLKKSTGKRDFLYELPWYIIIGPPGAGKTTALTRSGLKFYDGDRDGGAAPIAGTAGTRYCDWWFTDEAVLIDTAGRYTTHDSDAQSDKKSWLSFLQLLKRFRPKQPVNGVIVAISLKDLITLSPADLNAHSSAIRRRLVEVHETLRVDFPVYMLFTKADLIEGFKEYFGNFTETRRRKVWGATFQTEDRKKNLVAQVPSEFDLLVQRLMDEMADRLQEEYDPEARIKTFDFPAQFALLRPKVDEFLRQIFEPSRYQVSANLRGFYFSSGTQEGTPIDQVLGAMDESFGGAQGARSMSGGGKSFFLYDLITKVILSETGWGTLDPRAVRRQRTARIATTAVIGLATVLLLSGFTWSFINNKDLLQKTDNFVSKYRVEAAPFLSAQTVSDTDVRSVLGVLDGLSDSNPVGYAARDLGTPVGETFGLSQRDGLNLASEITYRGALEQLFRSRLILRVEQRLEEATEPVDSYEALKVYLMLGGKSDRPDPEFLVSWFKNDWQAQWPGPVYGPDRADLEKHLRAMLELEVGRPPTYALNGETIKAVQKRLAGLTIAKQAYAYLQRAAADSPDLSDINLAREIGPQADLVFETNNGTDLNDLTIPGLYTYWGFQNFFIPQLDAVADHVLGEQWVRGTDGQQNDVDTQIADLGPQLMALYAKDFRDTWNAALDSIKLKSLPGAPPYEVLNVLSNTDTSPIRGLVQAVANETALTREPPEDASANPAVDDALAKVASKATAKGTQLLNQKSKGLAKIGIGIAQGSKRSGRPGDATADAGPPGSEVESAFSLYAQLLDGQPSPVDGIVGSLYKVFQSLTVASQLSDSEATGENAKIKEQVAYLISNQSKFPPPLQRLIQQAAKDLRTDAANASYTQLKTAYLPVATQCASIVNNNYPFASKASRSIYMADFAGLFRPGGTLDTFFATNLAGMVDMTGKTWTWKQDDPLASQLDPNALLQFQRADQIKRAFFPLDTQMPQVKFTIRPTYLNPYADSAVLDIEGTQVNVTSQGSDPAVSVTWPGPTPGRVTLTFTPDIPPRASQRAFDGPWALYQFFRTSRVSTSGGTMNVRATVDGRDVAFSVLLESAANPFNLDALERFQCPSGL